MLVAPVDWFAHPMRWIGFLALFFLVGLAFLVLIAGGLDATFDPDANLIERWRRRLAKAVDYWSVPPRWIVLMGVLLVITVVMAIPECREALWAPSDQLQPNYPGR